MTKLKPCPWCKVSKYLTIQAAPHGENKWYAYVVCLKCFCKGPEIKGFAHTPELAEDRAQLAWNDRQDELPPVRLFSDKDTDVTGGKWPPPSLSELVNIRAINKKRLD